VLIWNDTAQEEIIPPRFAAILSRKMLGRSIEDALPPKHREHHLRAMLYLRN
jgi:hypothetical protein